MTNPYGIDLSLADFYPKYTVQWYQSKHMFIRPHPIVIQDLMHEIDRLENMDKLQNQKVQWREDSKEFLRARLAQLEKALIDPSERWF